jgi:glucan 1,3-beta-glucosidase
MNIHEYQGKEVLKQYGVLVPEGKVAFTVDEAVEAAKELGTSVVVVKAQIHAGGRGKAGGVKVAKNLDEVKAYASEILGKTLITHQTGPEGKEVKRLLIEQGCDIKKEYYVGVVVDRGTGRVVLMASEEGGTEIEEVAAHSPEKIFKEIVDPAIGLQAFQAKRLAFNINIPKELVNKAALKYDIDLLLDIHGLIGSQNGFDNSGKASAVKWTSIASTQPVGTTTFEHWPIRMAEWAGTFDPVNHNYSSINYSNLNQSLTAVTEIITRYAKHPAILGLQPVNEPWELTPIQVLKDYYWKSYKRVKALAPHWKFVLHDSFRFGVQYWSTFMKGCPDIALDTHIYQAWNTPGTQADFFSNACQQKYTITNMENALMPVIVGEWSLGTDNCVMWLNGFNDNLPGFPKVACKLEKCPEDSTYLGKGFPGTPLDVTKPIQGPYGTGMSGPSFGKCPVTSDNAFEQEDDADFTRNLNLKKLNAFALGHGWYFWNFKTEIGTKWNFLALIRQGAFPKNVSRYADEDGVFSACDKEDKGEFVCAAKRGVKKYELENGKAFACNAPGMDCKGLEDRFSTLEEQCDWAFNEYWHLNRESGATCDFGGAAHLLNIPDKAKHDSPPSETSTHSGSDGILSITHGSVIGLIGLIAVGLAVIGVVGLALYRWRQRRSRRGQYSPIGRA